MTTESPLWGFENGGGETGTSCNWWNNCANRTPNNNVIHLPKPWERDRKPIYYSHLLYTVSAHENVSFAFSHELPQRGINRELRSHGVKEGASLASFGESFGQSTSVWMQCCYTKAPFGPLFALSSLTPSALLLKFHVIREGYSHIMLYLGASALRYMPVSIRMQIACVFKSQHQV